MHHILHLGIEFRHDQIVKQGIQPAEDQSTDNDSDDDFDDLNLDDSELDKEDDYEDESTSGIFNVFYDEGI